MALICGIDEAGRGPIIGPLVICGAVIDEKDGARLKSIGVKDSKLLTPKQREDLFDKVSGIVKKYKILIIEPKEIDAAVESEALNLNWLEAIKSAEIIHELMCDLSADKTLEDKTILKAILDCPSNNISAYRNYVKNELKKLDNKNKITDKDSKNAAKLPEIVAEHKADFNYPVVSAASILAKVTRDAEIHKIEQRIRKELGNAVNIGSGYPSDPYTQKFLKEHYKKFAAIFRKSWATYKDIANSEIKAKAAKLQKKLGEF